MKARIQLIDWLRGTNILECYEQLRSFEALPGKIQNLRIQNLSNLLEYLKNNNKYYSAFLERFTNNELRAYPMVVLQNLPVIDKPQIKSNLDKIYSPDKHHPAQRKKTGGSTGEPFHYFVDKKHISWFWAHIYFFWNLYGGYEPGDPFVTIAGNSLRAVNRRAGESLYHHLQNNYFIKGDVIHPEMKISESRISKAVILYGYPGSIQNLVKIRPDLPGEFKNLRAVFTTSEQLTPQSRKNIETLFGKPVFDMYGANDGGILSCECAEHNGYHINMLNCYAENFWNENSLCEILLTNLSSYTFPFVRYRVGDLGMIKNEPCACGLAWPRITELKGRTRDMIKLPSGEMIHGSFFNHIFYRFPAVEKYRIIQLKDYSVEILIQVSGNDIFEKVSKELENFMLKEWPLLKITIKRLPELNPTDSKFQLIESHVV